LDPSTYSRHYPILPKVHPAPRQRHQKPDVSASETGESLQVEIPAPEEFEGVDYKDLLRNVKMLILTMMI